MTEPTRQFEPVHLGVPAARVERLSLRWFAAAAIIGTISAFAAAVVRLAFRGLEWLLVQSSAAPPEAGAHLPFWRRAITPVVGALLASVVLYLRKRRAHRLGREPRPYVEYVEAVRERHGFIPFVPNCWRTLSAACSIASGAAVGREGSMIQFAAATSSAAVGWLAQRLGDRDALDASMLVACGVAGGVTTAYNAPVAAVFFAAEIVLGAIRAREVVLLGLAAAAGWVVSGLIQGFQRLYPTHASLFAGSWTIALLPVLALFFGAVGPLYQKLIRSLRGARVLPLPLVWSGAIVGLVSTIDPRVWGNGDLGLSAALGRAQLPWLPIGVPALAMLLGLRLMATTACVGTGTVGGVFTPTLFAGAAAAALLGHAFPSVNPTLWAIVGMSLLMAAVTHAPLMAAFMAVELTGDWPLLPMLIVLNLIAWQLARRFSNEALYAIASQMPARPDQAEPPSEARYNEQRTA